MLKKASYQRSSAGSTVGSTVGSTLSVKRTSVSGADTTTNGSTLSVPELARKRQGKKDDAFRKKLDQELSQKKPSLRVPKSARPTQGTVGSLR